MDLDINGKTALVTGAGRGIGLAITKALAAEGVRVVGAARTLTPELKQVATATVAVDLSTREGATTVVDRAIEKVGEIDFLVNNIGWGDSAAMGLGGVLDVSEEQWQATIGLNLFSPVWTTRAALPSIVDRRGAIVNISSISARLSAIDPMGYGEAKAALTMFGKRVSEEFGPRGVRVNTVSPGPIGGRTWRGEDGFGSKLAEAAGVPLDEFLAALPEQSGIALRRLGEPEEVADLVTFLLSERAAHITGADFVIDGGTIKTV
ncbi:SDR family oxidoreductase [Glycomyces sp. L485]|uniref:SDR family oxidoreductase n=1 Tax=Glycomyces sp. L485 TaxID=2909235 RepID=UPI001F4B212E|nr:SDR family oxidoreductase [Glycomyces sp. L485]MCH7232234.1 SDR family oxidoreductase [Glycomyces sp. L485]